VADWATISSLATAGGTLVLAVATFASVRSANQAARVAERSLAVNLRPLLLPSRPADDPQKVHFADDHWLMVEGAGAACEVTDEAVYLAMSVRNVGTGIAVLHGWQFLPERRGGDAPAPSLDGFHRLTRDLYVPAGDISFWQGVLRDPAEPDFARAREAIEARRPFALDILYGDNEGGQRVVSRFGLAVRGDAWFPAAGRHWNIDRPDPR
jgi:hypothetical protein